MSVDSDNAAADPCHIHVSFTSPPVELDYQDDRDVADRFAAAMARSGATVTIDEDLGRDLPLLPCRRLWL
ncbi:hypothetical protein [Nocardia sp. alder85J]|uniref:hypothetical protein n=1 Tax=Nocardia sp. alder85J TaxID=2862949 RepID=UPI001CD3DC03|nr:hypothetical protein [Nocardia sp. alder85J]MCX4095899.1 hypothetical protein [Nocardia sp. alder85J]